MSITSWILSAAASLVAAALARVGYLIAKGKADAAEVARQQQTITNVEKANAARSEVAIDNSHGSVPERVQQFYTD